jgi:HlyD family secretion protein
MKLSRPAICRAMRVVSLVTLAAGCSRADVPDAYGNVEATEVVVGAQNGGQLLSFDPKEGDSLAAAAVVGAIDATELALERDQVTAQRGANASRVTEVAQQIQALQAQRDAAAAQRDAAKAQRGALEVQHTIAQRAYERTKRLFDQQAATAQQLDQAERDVRVLTEQMRAHDEQIAAQDHQVAAQREQIDAARAQRDVAVHQVAALDAQVARIGERIRKSEIRNPIAGTVLASYAKAGEIVQPGQRLYKIADLAAMEVRAYIAEVQLARVHLGDAAAVSFDTGKGARRELQGRVSWVSSEAEFTPTPIQTRDERTDLVYAIKIRVANEDRTLKIGMPVDVRFIPASGTR